KPVISRRCSVLYQHRSAIVDRDQNVDRAVVVKVADGKTTGRPMLREHWPAFGAHILKCFPRIMEKQWRLAVSHSGMQRFDQVIRIPIGEKQVEVSVVIVIEKLQAPTAHEARSSGDTGLESLVVEGLVMVVL